MGGSVIEDFLDLAIGFALLTCFGIALPVMAVIAFVAYVVKYRLLAYRMVNITCRPYPVGCEGIGNWQAVFHSISIIAVICNVLMAVFVMYPMRDWPMGNEFAA